MQVGAGLSVLGGTRTGGVCRTGNRAWVASPWGLESGQQPGLPLQGLPQAPGHRARGPEVRVGHREVVGTTELDTAVSPERGPAGASEPSRTAASVNGCAQGTEPGGSLCPCPPLCPAPPPCSSHPSPLSQPLCRGQPIAYSCSHTAPAVA